MVRTGSEKTVPDNYWRGRLRKARQFHAIARDAIDLHEDGSDAGPVMSNIILAAVAYGDAVTAATRRTVNQKDHAALPRLLRASLGNEFPQAQERALASMLGKKDQVQYGAVFHRLQDAMKMVEQLDAFAAWSYI